VRVTREWVAWAQAAADSRALRMQILLLCEVLITNGRGRVLALGGRRK